jgi:hypothetical protein
VEWELEVQRKAVPRRRRHCGFVTGRHGISLKYTKDFFWMIGRIVSVLYTQSSEVSSALVRDARNGIPPVDLPLCLRCFLQNNDDHAKKDGVRQIFIIVLLL